MAVFSPTNAKVHFKAYDGNFTDAQGNTAITQNNGVAMSTAQKLFGQKAMFMANFSDSITFNTPSVFDVGTGDYTVGFWFHPTQLTSYDRLFATGPDSGGNPFRIYNHNGSIGVYVENDDEVPGDTTHDLIINYYLGADAANQWWHIMVQRNSGTTKLYIDGTEQGSSTVSYEIDNSSSPTLGADINAAATGVKGYIQDFFWTEEAVSFSQADFDPSTPEPIAFHSGNPSISSFSTSATSVDNSGDTVTLSWNVSGETKLELLKYISGILSSTEDVLGLSSKTVTITQTVSYILRTTNDNGVVDSSSLNISLGGNEMAIQNALSGSAIAKSMQVNVNLLGGVSYDDATGRVAGLAVGAAGSGGRTAQNALSASFGRTETIIEALNHLKAGATAIQPAGPTGSIQLAGAGDVFNSVSGLTVNSDGDAHLPARLHVTGAADLNSTLTVDGQTTLGNATAAIVTNAGLVTIANTTAATSKETGALAVAGGISTQTKLHAGTGITTDAGGLTVTAGASQFGASVSIVGSLTASKDISVGESLSVTGPATVGGALGVVGLSSFTAGATFAASVTASKDLSVGESLSVTGDSVLGGDLGVVGAADLNGNVSLGNAAGDTINVAGTMTVATPFTASKDVSVGQKLLAAKGILLTGSLNHATNKFGDLPKFQIQGTNAIGRFQDYHIAVSGGILRAIEL